MVGERIRFEEAILTRERPLSKAEIARVEFDLNRPPGPSIRTRFANALISAGLFIDAEAVRNSQRALPPADLLRINQI